MKKKLIGYSIYFMILIMIQVIATLMKYNLDTLWEVMIIILGIVVIASSGTLRFSSNKVEKQSEIDQTKRSTLFDVVFAFGLMIPVLINIFFL
ncbi:MAG: hypothetical protein RSA06_06895 [Erysipelotrichaceae bacterium]